MSPRQYNTLQDAFIAIPYADGDINIRLDLPTWRAGETVSLIPGCCVNDADDNQTTGQSFAAQLSGGREGLLVDTGAFGNLVGSEWVNRMKAIASRCKRSICYSPLKQSITVDGVGTGSSKADQQAEVPIALDGEDSRYTSPMVPDSTLPALWGFGPMEEKKAIVDTGGRKVLIPGPGGYRIFMSPGSRILDCEKTASGHMMIPCSEFGAKSKRGALKQWTAYGSAPQGVVQQISGGKKETPGSRSPAVSML